MDNTELNQLEARELWSMINAQLFPLIQQAVEADRHLPPPKPQGFLGKLFGATPPARRISQDPRYARLLANPHLLSRPDDYAALFGEKIYPECQVIASQTIQAALALRGYPPISMQAEYIINRIAAWCSGQYDYDIIDPYLVNSDTLMKLAFKGKNVGLGDIEPAEPSWKPNIDVYASWQFLGTISVVLAILFNNS